MRFEECESFKRYEPLVGRLNEKATRSKSDMAQDMAVVTVGSMVTKDSIFAVRADNVRTNYFLLLCVLEEKEHLDAENAHTDQVGNAIYYGTKYVTRKYLEISNFTNRYHEFNVQRKNIAVIGETVFFPQVPTLFVSKSNTTFKISNEIIHELQVRSSIASE